MLRQTPLFDNWVSLIGMNSWELFSPKVVVISDSEYQKRMDEIKERRDKSRMEFLGKCLDELGIYIADITSKKEQAMSKRTELLKEIAKLDKPTETKEEK